MRLRELIAGTPAEVRGADDVEVESIAIHSGEVTERSLFVAVNGVALDGHDFLPEAVARSASALVVEDPTRVPDGFGGPVVVVPNARVTLNHAAGRIVGDPGRELFCVTITGTDGKSTVAWMVEPVLEAVGLATGVIGTVDHHFRGRVWPGDTTPPPLVLQQRLRQLVDLGAKAVALEATSQGLSQSRVGSVPLDVAVFTNLTRDHLDYHGTLDAYFAAKERLFTETLAASPKRLRHAVINVDTEYGARIRVPSNVHEVTYGRRDTGADLVYEVVKVGLEESVFRFTHEGDEADLRMPMLGAFNGANALAAVAVGMAAGGAFRSCVEALVGFAGVPGRVQRVSPPGGKAVFIDYAHDPHAFAALLPNVKAAMEGERPDGELVTVFGCGGDRDRGKRPLMLREALRWSDRVVVTSDNPRREDPQAIVAEILAGAEDTSRVAVELDRAEAIAHALTSTGDDDVVMVLGKGHEPYQIVGERRLPYSDLAVVEAQLRENG